MREPAPTTPSFGLMAEFDRPERLMESVRRAREAGFRRMDAYSPFPIDGLAEELGFRDRRVPRLTLFGGVFGAAVGYGMQVYTNLAFPIEIGGRPLIATQAFMLITFELTVLFAVLFAIGGMLALNRLPRLHHPLFDVEAFHLASADKFFLVIFSNDAMFDPGKTRGFLEGFAPVRIDVVEHTEEPE
ncbi:MAG: DUF3341 domain-containing protein [Hyphomicrobiaceae bacterium]|nr:DUF3341 domain-containing protein [Hyphomicrobiaceae bacterium]